MNVFYIGNLLINLYMVALVLYLLESHQFLKKTEQYNTTRNILNNPTSYVPIVSYFFHVSSYIIILHKFLFVECTFSA